MAVGLVKLHHKQTALISAYMDITQEATPPHLNEAIKYCKSKGYSIIICADTNSHSKIWGNTTNTRGKLWEKLIEEEELIVSNTGKIPTYESKLGKSIIDVTLTYRLPQNLSNWRVLRSYNGTDHNSINFSLENSIPVSYTHLTLPTTPYV